MLDGMIGLNGIALPAAYEAKLGDLAPYLRQMGVGFDLSLPSAWGAGWMVLVLSALLVIVWAMPNSLQLLAPFRPALSAPEPLRLPVSLRRLAMRLRLVAVNGSFVFNGASGLLIGILLFSSLLFQSVRSTTLHPFIYFQF